MLSRTVGGLLALLLAQAPAHQTAAPTKRLTLQQVWTLDATYADAEHGVTFRYPSRWDSMLQFGYHPPALTQSEPKPIAGFGYEEGGFPRENKPGPYAGTTLEGFGMVYSAVPVADSAACDAKAADVSGGTKQSQAIFGGRSFSVFETEGAGMSQSMEGKLYATYVQPTCYLFETNMAMGGSAAEEAGVKALTQQQSSFIDEHLLAMMRSVRIQASAKR